MRKSIVKKSKNAVGGASTKKQSFIQKLKRRFAEFRSLGEILFRTPRQFPSALLSLFKRFLRNVWDVRGGGLYAVGIAVVLIWLEFWMLVDDVLNFSGFGGFSIQSIIRFVIQFFVESLTNTVRAFIWPAEVIKFYPPWGLVALVAMFLVFPRTLKRPLERWLFDGDGGSRAK